MICIIFGEWWGYDMGLDKVCVIVVDGYMVRCRGSNIFLMMGMLSVEEL